MNSKKLLYIISSFVVAVALIFLPIYGDWVKSGRISYHLDWTWDDATPDETGQGWMVTNDLGYKVHLEQGYLVTRSIELIACEQDYDNTISEIIFDLLLPPPAYASHGTEDHDISRISVPYIESLANPTAIELETVSGTESAYCQVHYLIAPGIETARNLPTELDMLGISLFIKGDYKAPDADTAVPFVISTQLPWGTMIDLNALEMKTDNMIKTSFVTGSEATKVIIHRDLGSMFDGVAFNHMSDIDQAKMVLRSLTQSTKVMVTSDS